MKPILIGMAGEIEKPEGYDELEVAEKRYREYLKDHGDEIRLANDSSGIDAIIEKAEKAGKMVTDETEETSEDAKMENLLQRIEELQQFARIGQAVAALRNYERLSRDCEGRAKLIGYGKIRDYRDSLAEQTAAQGPGAK